MYSLHVPLLRLVKFLYIPDIPQDINKIGSKRVGRTFNSGDDGYYNIQH